MSSAQNKPPAVMFLNEAARYFENRPKNGEDASHWSNVYNSENCRATAKLIEQMLEALKIADNGIYLSGADLLTIRAAIAKATGARVDE